jgi:lipopolysaccharide export LptBFGC system permease protein LptF
VDEYRFEAQFNWTRTQYMMVFNTGVLAAALAVAAQGGRSAVLIFGFGVIAAGVSVLVVRTQHDYYRAARDRMRRI